MTNDKLVSVLAAYGAEQPLEECLNSFLLLENHLRRNRSIFLRNSGEMSKTAWISAPKAHYATVS